MTDLIATAPTLDAIKDAVARFYCGESKTLIPAGPDAWQIVHTDSGEQVQGVQVIRKAGRFRFENCAVTPALTPALTPAMTPAIGGNKNTCEQSLTPDENLRALWTAQGVSEERQNEVLAQITAKAQPGARIGPFTIGQPSENLILQGKQVVGTTEPGADGLPQLVIPGAERATTAQLLARRMQEAKRGPKVAQREPGGLFSATVRDQLSLF